MGLFRYITEGFGWELGRQGARAAIDEVKHNLPEEQPPLTEKEKQKLLADEAKRVAAEKKAHEAAVAKKKSEIEDQLAALKKKAGK